MDSLVRTLAEIYRAFGERIGSDSYRLRLELEQRHGADSRIPLLESAGRLGAPRRLVAGEEPGRLSHRLALGYGYSRAASTYAIAAWATACGTANLGSAPSLRPAPSAPLAELVKARLMRTVVLTAELHTGDAFRTEGRAA